MILLSISKKKVDVCMCNTNLIIVAIDYGRLREKEKKEALDKKTNDLLLRLMDIV